MVNALSAASSGVDGQEEIDMAELPNTRCTNEKSARGPLFRQVNPTVTGVAEGHV